jgi:hypothetical protein
MSLLAEQDVALPEPRYLAPLSVYESHPASPEAVAALRELELAMHAQGKTMSIPDMTSHYFCDGVYARQWNQAAGVLAVSKIHAKENFLLLLSGECLISSGETTVRISAPFITKTFPGVKRAVMAITDCTLMTFHSNPDNERDMIKLEDRFIIPESLPGAPEIPEVQEDAP